MKISQFARNLLNTRYKKPFDKNEEDIIRRACKAFSDNEEHYKRLLKYFEKKWWCPSSPILSNAPLRNKWDTFNNNFKEECFESDTISKAMPISCFVTYVGDNIDSLLENTSETRYMSVIGGGVGIYVGDIRAEIEGGKSPGPIPFLKTYDSDVIAYHQAGSRRGSYAVFMDIHHPDIEEFIQGRSTSGGDVNRKFPNLNHGVNITDAFVEAVANDSLLELKDPHTKQVIRKVRARDLWFRLLETRHKTGEPYIIHIDSVNQKMNPLLKEKGLKIYSTNLCQYGHH